jgi:hypothetical protein
MPRHTTDEYEDRNDDPGASRPRPAPRPQSGGGSSVAKLIILLGAVFGGLCLLCCGGLTALYFLQPGGPGGAAAAQAEQARAEWKKQEAAATSEQQKAKAFVHYWLALVRLDQLDEAYRRTTTAFQSRMTRADFDRFIQQNRELRSDTAGWSYGLDGHPRTRFTFLLSRPRNAPYWISTAREGDEWKLDEIDAK